MKLIDVTKCQRRLVTVTNRGFQQRLRRSVFLLPFPA